MLRYRQACVFKEHLRARPGQLEQVSCQEADAWAVPALALGFRKEAPRGLRLCCEQTGGRRQSSPATQRASARRGASC